MSWASLLLLRRLDAVFAVATTAVREIEDAPAGVRIALTGGELYADQVLGVVRGMVVRSPGRVLRRFWAEPVAGIAVHDRAPVVVVDPRRPPRVLLGEGVVDGEPGR